MSSFCGVNRICKIALFIGDSLARVLLKQSKAINENDISTTLKNPGLSGCPEITILFVVKKCMLVERERAYKYNTG